MSSLSRPVLESAFQRLLPKEGTGNFAFASFFGEPLIREMCVENRLTVPGWDVYGITPGATCEGVISGDRAVELREDKVGNVLLLIDPAATLSGMDGIYSAALEIKEHDFFLVANEQAITHIKRDWQKLSRKAVEKARKIGRQNTVSPWEEFFFYISVAQNVDDFGHCLAKLGLWPIALNGKPDESELIKSLRLVERLLLTTGAVKTPAMRVSGLALIDAKPELVRDLEDFVRRSSSKGWRDAILELCDRKQLWINNIRPGLFDSDVLKSIELVRWRIRSDSKPAAWSGLRLSDTHGGVPRIAINPTPASAKDRSKLEVRWKANPEGLRAGTVEYSVSVIAGDDLLAEQRIVHSGKEPQKAKFTEDDFSELEDGSTFEARIVVRVIGNESLEVATEDFLLSIGSESKETISGAGKESRCLVEGLAALSSDDFAQALQGLSGTGVACDKKGFLICKGGQKSFRVRRPKIFAEIEASWLSTGGKVGRWSQTIGPDGSRIGSPMFLPIEKGEEPGNLWSRIGDASSSFCKQYSQNQSLLMSVYRNSKHADEYVNAWSAAFEACSPDLLLANTLEVKSISGRSIGLIVLPMHAIRVAWHYGYDSLVAHSAHEDGVPAKSLESLFNQITGANYPFLLPGFSKDSFFVFGDMLGFFFPGMLHSNDAEPKASLALLARAMSDDNHDITPSLGVSTGQFLGKEVRRYMELHSGYHNLHVNALKAGDGRIVSYALGRSIAIDSDDESDEHGLYSNKGFTVRLVSPGKDGSVTGSYLVKTSEKRRVGASGVGKDDRWMLESYTPYQGASIPRLKWAKIFGTNDLDPAHISMSFDAFASGVSSLPDVDRLQGVPLEVYGLVAPVRRDFHFQPRPLWITYLAQTGDGEKHPVSKPLTDRLLRMHSNLLRAAGRNFEGGDGYPVLLTELQGDDEERLMELHTVSDWVITIDRNGGIEYFDSPKDARKTYDSYVIDCVPERPALGTMQLVTSTSRLEELTNLLGSPLLEMGLSCSPRNSEFLLSKLKGLSGKLAMKLANQSQQPGELIALALVYANCLQPSAINEWFDLRDGFFVPLDDVPELIPTGKGNQEESGLRADLVYVMVPKRGGLQFAFVECKYRRYLKTSRSADLLSTIEAQIKSTSNYWEREFLFPTGSAVEVDIKRHVLARILKFYAAKAKRHYLQSDAYARLERELDKFVAQGKKYTVGRLPDKGYIFCPESLSADPDYVSRDGTTEIIIFGPHQMPDLPSTFPRISPTDTIKKRDDIEGKDDDTDGGAEEDQKDPVAGAVKKPNAPDSHPDRVPEPGKEDGSKSANRPVPVEGTPSNSDEYAIVLGTTIGDEPVYWRPSTSTNPHLMIVGLPGMGKTTSLLSITEQMVKQGGNPIVFSYHEDFDERISQILNTSTINFVDFNGLGFNPLRVLAPDNPLAYLDNASNLRDIFAAVFPELGDLQVERIRDSIKKSYLEQGWAAGGHDLVTPEFQRFFDILVSMEKPGSGLVARLSELNDYGFFKNSGTTRSVLDNRGLTIVRLHRTNNEYLQRAFASFVLYNIYQEMFTRGPQSTLINSVIFDEAHKASKLKLLGTMGKECRKFGIALLVSSQEVKDFNSSLFAAVSNYLLLRLTEVDARIAAKSVAPSDLVVRVTDRLKAMEKWHGYFFSESLRRPEVISLTKV
jgi:hypothetical protein